MLGVGLGREAGRWVLGRALNTLVRGRLYQPLFVPACKITSPCLLAFWAV